jgi:hypothetical protein
MSGVAAAAVKNRNLAGFFKTADGAWKKGNTAKAAGGAAAVGVGSWMIFDDKAGEKLGAGLGNVGSGIGGALSGLLGGLGQGLLGGLLVPGALCCCCCIISAIVAYMQMR